MPGIPQLVCPACKAVNEPGCLLCKRCGEILPKKGKLSKGAQEYDATEGALKPSCIVIPIAIAIVIGLIIFFSLRGPKPGTCEFNRQKIVAAIYRFNKANPNQKMTTLDLDALLKPDSKGKSHLKDKPVCPVNPSAQYLLDPEGGVICTNCNPKK
ncbi:MAG: hypothetical protein HQM08_11575 [Candidatus Riflebacteria bacterium]|nr:hypothetical protein [Candidatus Riflebacteria bacterium]